MHIPTYKQIPEVRWIRAKKVPLSLIGLVLILTILAPPAVSQERLHVEDNYLDTYDLDPIAVALAVTTAKEAAAFYARQTAVMDNISSTTQENPGTTIDAPGGNVLSDDAGGIITDSTSQIASTYTALESAVDELYDSLSRTPGAQTIANQWSRCMSRDGFNYQSPVEIESDIDRGQTDNLTKLLESRDKCLAEIETATERLVLELLPDWKREHTALLSSYNNALNWQATE